MLKLRRKFTLKKPKLLGSIAIFIIISTLSGAFMVSPVDAAMMFSEVQITSNTSAQEYPDIYQYGVNNNAIVWQDNRNGNWDIYMYYQKYLGNGIWDVRPDVRITTMGNNTNPRISGDTIVYQSDRSGNWDIYTYNLTSKVETQITHSVASQEFPAIDGNIIAWQDDGDGNIYAYNMTTQTQQAITTSGSCYNPSVSGNRIVYENVKTYIAGSSNDRWTDYYIYCFDLSTRQEIASAEPGYTDQSSHTSDVVANPAIYGDQVVWMRQSWHTFEYEWNIYLGTVGGGAYWSTGYSTANQVYPDIFEHYIVYQDDRNGANGGADIYLYNIDTKTEYRVTNNTYSQAHPAIYGNYIVYMDNRNGNWDIYLTLYSPTAGSTGPNSSYTPAASVVIQGSANSGNQELRTIIVISTIAVVIVVVSAAALMASKQRKSEKPKN